MQVAKWGNSLAVRLPVALAERLGVREGDEISLMPARRRAGAAAAAVSRQASKRELLLVMRRHRGAFPKGFKFDRDEANTR